MADEVEKEQPKTYSLEEILARTKSNSLDIFPTSGAKDWIENPTRFKLREAKYFFEQVQKTYHDYLNNDIAKNRDILLLVVCRIFCNLDSPVIPHISIRIHR
jgi:hypothetical protein